MSGHPDTGEQIDDLGNSINTALPRSGAAIWQNSVYVAGVHSVAEPSSLAGTSRRSLDNPALSLHDPQTWDEIFGESIGSDSGEKVTHQKSLGYAPIRQAVLKLSGDVAKLPLACYQSQGKDDRKRKKTHVVERLLGKNGVPSEEVNVFKFWRRFAVHLLLWENAYAYVDYQDGKPVEIINLLPDRTSPFYHKGKLFFITEFTDPRNEKKSKLKALPADQVLHVEGICWDGIAGSDMIKDFRHDIGVALAARKFTSKFFRNNLHAGGILEVPPGTSKEAKEKVEKGLREEHTKSDNAFKTMVLRDGFKWHRTTVNPTDAQLTEVDEQQARHTARMFNIHPSQLGVKDSTSYNSLEQAKADYYDGALSHLLFAIQSEVNLKLLTKSERERGYYCEHIVNALLWADARSRNEIACRGIEVGRWSPNETRAWENMSPYKGGDIYRTSLNTAPVGSSQGEGSGSGNSDGNSDGNDSSDSIDQNEGDSIDSGDDA